jgi:hypothetical protein
LVAPACETNRTISSFGHGNQSPTGLPLSRFFESEPSEVTMHLDPDFSEFVECFTVHDVRYLVVGGYALAAHGLPRATGDFDAWIWVDDENAKRVVAALTAFGFGQLGLTVDDFNRPDSVVQLGYPPYRVDILTSIDGVDFSDAWTRRLTVEVDGRPLQIIGRADLVANKVAAGRPQDLADVERLRAHNPEVITHEAAQTIED